VRPEPDCCSNGRTIEEARRNLRKAIQQRVAARPREPVPQVP
jgi:predicted RNase H-like HicB family nuclease